MGSQEGLSARAILIGIAVDFGGTLIATSVLMIVIGITVGARMMPSHPDPKALTEQMQALASKTYPVFVLIGVFFDLLGGYTAAAVAKGSKMANALAAGVILTVMSIPFVLGNTGGSETPLMKMVSIAVILPGVLLGGCLAAPRTEKPKPYG